MAIRIDLAQRVKISTLFKNVFEDADKPGRDEACLAFQRLPELERERKGFEGLPWSNYLISYFQHYAILFRLDHSVSHIYDLLADVFNRHAGDDDSKKAEKLLPERSVLELLAYEVMASHGLDAVP